MNEQQSPITDAVMTAFRSNRLTRRQAVRILGAFGLATTALPAVARHVAGQEAGSATPAATPVLGPQDDGSNLWKVQVGGMDMEHGIDNHAFFPGDITINAGDAIYFAFSPMGMPGFHTVTFTSGEELPPLFEPDMVDGTPVASPQGPPRLMLNPQIVWPDGRDSYDGTGFVNSGIDVFRADQGPYILSFPTPGSYTYECALHSIVMKGSVTVQEAGADLPYTLDEYETMAADQFASLVAEGTAAIDELSGADMATPAAGGATTWAVAAGAGGLSSARVMRFIPADLTIKVGDTVRWTDMSTGEPHTVTFLGGAEQPEDTIVEPQPNGMPKLIQSYDTLLPSGGPEFDGTGYTNSGFLGLPPEISGPLGLAGESWDLTFTAAGEYPYYCVLHAGGPDDEYGMVGKVTVEAS